MSSLALRRPSAVKPMTLVDLCAAVGAGRPRGCDGDGPPVGGVTLDSRAVLPGDLYAALPGASVHGARFVAAARDAGAVAVLTDGAGAAGAASAGLPAVVVDDPRAVLAQVAATLYGHPSRSVRTTAVTGTNGKTTTTYLLHAAVELLTGAPAGLMGTVETRIGPERLPSRGTTPEAPVVHGVLAAMRDAGVRDCAMEVSSHALVQHRVDGVEFTTVAFTNLSQDHLDYHAGIDDYFEAKASLFTRARARRAVVCVDDAWGRRLADLCAARDLPVVTVRTAPPTPAPPGPAATWQVQHVHVVGGLPAATVHGPDVEVEVVSPLPGTFNLANTLVSLAVLVGEGHDAHAAARALAAVPGVPGRMERVTSAPPGSGAPPAVGEPLAVVDFAHTPDAVAAAVGALRGAGSPLVVVLGAGGDRDATKRPLMGAAAAQVADVVVVTDDNPRSEVPAEIRAAVLEGARGAAHRRGAAATPGGPVVVLEEPDRSRAVAEGVRRAWGSGVLLVAGKGHERGQEVAGVVHPFDDREVLRGHLGRHAATCAAAAADGAPAPGPAPVTGTEVGL